MAEDTKLPTTPASKVAVVKPKNPMIKCQCVTECTTRINGEIRHCYPGRVARFLKCPDNWVTVESLKEED